MGARRRANLSRVCQIGRPSSFTQTALLELLHCKHSDEWDGLKLGVGDGEALELPSIISTESIIHISMVKIELADFEVA